MSSQNTVRHTLRARLAIVLAGVTLASHALTAGDDARRAANEARMTRVSAAAGADHGTTDAGDSTAVAAAAPTQDDETDEWCEEYALPTSLDLTVTPVGLHAGIFSPALKILIADNLGLTELPTRGVENLTGLEALHLTNNRLTEIPDIWGTLPSLTALNVSFNQLRSLPSALRQLRGTLRTLGLSNNPIAELPSVIGELNALNTLHCAKTHMTYLPCWLFGMADLRNAHFIDTPDLRVIDYRTPAEAIGAPTLGELALHVSGGTLKGILLTVPVLRTVCVRFLTNGVESPFQPIEERIYTSVQYAPWVGERYLPLCAQEPVRTPEDHLLGSIPATLKDVFLGTSGLEGKKFPLHEIIVDARPRADEDTGAGAAASR